MHKTVFEKFEEICSGLHIRGSVLEVGATPDDTSLLNMKALDAAAEKIGLNLDGPHHYGNFQIIRGNANAMTCFEDNRFDVVLCNSVLEHDRCFWKTLSEITRVTRSGGIVVIGAPGYGPFPGNKFVLGMAHLLSRVFPRVMAAFPVNSAITLKLHSYPADYYRFSEQAFRDVILAGMERVEVWSIMSPPRWIGLGIKPVRNGT